MMSTSYCHIQAFHLDMKLAQYRADYLIRLFPLLREAGYNMIVFEIENKVRLDCLGSATWCEAFSKSEFAGILGHCRAAGLKTVPLIQSYAHLEWLLTHEPFHKLREQPSIAYTICPLKDESRTFLHRYIDEVGELFSDPEFIHLGGDEAAYMGTCPACSAIAKTDGKGALYALHMGRIASHVLSRGWRPLLWADMALAHPECLRTFPKESVWVDWHYAMTPEGPEIIQPWGEKNRQTPQETSEVFRRTYGAYAFQSSNERYHPWFYADYLLDQGFDVLIASAASCAGDHAFLPSFSRTSNIASASLKLRDEPRLLGQLVTSWAMRMTPLEAQWPLLRLPASIQVQSTTTEWTTAIQTACHQTFGRQILDFDDHWRILGTSFWWAESHHGFDWETGYVGQPAPIPLLFARRLRDGELNLCKEIENMEALLAKYTNSAQLLSPHLDKSDQSNLSALAWQTGLEAIQLRVREYQVYLHAQNGQINSAEATEILHLTEAKSDRWQNLLSHIYQPAGILVMNSIIYGETRRLLPNIGWGRFEKILLSS